MAFNEFKDAAQQRSYPRPMIDVSSMNIKCRDCATPITELPFTPDPARLDTLRCAECMRKFREQNPRPRRY